MWMGRKLFCALVAALLIMPIIGAGQHLAQEPKSKRDDDPIKLEATLVQVPVIVSAPGGRYVADMRREEFALFEDGVKQEIALFGKVEEPFKVALLIDSSGSTFEQLEQIKSAAIAFVENLRDHDRVMVMSFNDSVEVLCDLTSDRGVLRHAIGSIQPGEFTQVYDAVYTAVWERLRDMTGRKAVILFSDGIDTASTEISADDTLDAVVDVEDTIVYAIRYNTRPFVERKLAERQERPAINSQSRLQVNWEERLSALDATYASADDYLEDLTELSGGLVERADRLADLKSAFAKIAEELRYQYMLGYYPTKVEDGGHERRIAVKVLREGVRVRARPGYQK
jgi:Ca-activated chloride channel family protein